MKDKFRANFDLRYFCCTCNICFITDFRSSGNFTCSTGVLLQYYKSSAIHPSYLVASLLGVNVFAVLTGGILFSGAIGLATGSFSALELANNVYNLFRNVRNLPVIYDHRWSC